MSKANEVQIGGTHYKSKAIQPWDYITSNDLGYLEGNVVKYVSRWKDKGGLVDLEKAMHNLQKLIEVETDKAIQKEAVRLGGFLEGMAEGRPKKKQKGE